MNTEQDLIHYEKLKFDKAKPINFINKKREGISVLQSKNVNNECS